MRCIGRLACVAAVLAGFAGSATAQNTWTGSGTSALWSDAGNWAGPPGSPTPPATDAMLFFVGGSGTGSVNDGAVSSLKPQVIGSSYGITFLNDGTAGKTAAFRISGSALALNGNITNAQPTTSIPLTITDEIACDIQLVQATDFTQVYLSSFGSFSHNLLISGVISESGGSRTLRKNGTGGTLFLSGENVFTGQMQISVGSVSVDRIENVSQPAPLGAGNLPIRLGQGQFGGTLIYTGTGETNNRYFQIGSGPNNTATAGGTITANGTGPVVFTSAGRDLTHPLYGNNFFNQNDGVVIVPDRTLTLNGTNAGANEIQTVIIDNVRSTTNVVSKINVTKTGSGTWILSGSNTYTGTTTVSGGLLQVGNGGAVGQLGSGPVVNNATLAFNRSDDVTITAAISGSGRLVKAGAGTLTFGTAQPYTGATRIDAGTLSLGETGAIAASPSVTVGDGAFFSVADQPGGVYAVPATQTLGGNGTLVGNLAVAGGATVAPGASPGTLGVTDGVTLGAGGHYNWQILDAAGTAGSTTGWDLLSVGGVLDVAATAATPFRLNLWSLSGVSPDVNGNAINWTATTSGTWRIASAAGGITNFAANKFLINVSATNGTGGFTNPLSGGTFSLAQSGNNLNLVFTSAAPPVITINVASGTQTQGSAGFPLLAGTAPVQKTGAGTVVFDQANTLTGPTTVAQGALVLGNAAALSSSPVTVAAGAKLSVGPQVAAVVPALVNNGLVDVGLGSLTITSGQGPATLVAAIVAGRNDGTWDGATGITSSAAAAQSERAVGWLNNGDGSFTVAFGAAGDWNLNGVVDFDDVVQFVSANLYDTGLPATWADGDYDYNGVVDFDDVVASVSANLFDTGPYNTAPGSLALLDFAGGVAAVPEPATWVLVAVGAICAACGRLGGGLPRANARKRAPASEASL